MRGKFIVFEGIDRSGKSTQSKRLAHHLNADLIAFPDRSTKIGTCINDYLTASLNLSPEVIHLLFSANRWESQSKLESTLLAGKTVVCDRYAWSGVAYTTAIHRKDEAWCAAPDKGLIAPDVVFYIDAGDDCVVTRGREGSTNDRYETLERQRAVYSAFHNLKGPGWVVVDGLRDEETIHQEIVAHLKTLPEPNDSFKRLWD